MTSTTPYRPSDLVPVAFPFASGTQTKRRPALVVLDTGDADVVLARVTTRFHRTPYDVALQDWQGAGLLAASVVRLHKLATLERSLVVRVLGRLPTGDRALVAAAMGRMFGAW